MSEENHLTEAAVCHKPLFLSYPKSPIDVELPDPSPSGNDLLKACMIAAGQGYCRIC